LLQSGNCRKFYTRRSLCEKAHDITIINLHHWLGDLLRLSLIDTGHHGDDGFNTNFMMTPA